MKKFIGVNDVHNVPALVRQALDMKLNEDSPPEIGKGLTIGLLFLNPSLRTRMSTHLAALKLGFQIMSLNAEEGWKLETEENIIMDGDKAEHIIEAAGVMSQYCDLIGVRCFPGLKNRDEDYADIFIEKFSRYATVPIFSLESAIRHPLQSLADLMTIKEHQKATNPKIVLSWAPHPRALPQAVPNSFSEWVLGAGHDLTITHPKGYELKSEFTKGASIEYNQEKALEGADFVYAKNWSSFQDYGKILCTDSKWMIDQDKMSLTNRAKFMHCLPVRRNVVVSDVVIDGPDSLVLNQAANRVFAAQAVLTELAKHVKSIKDETRIAYH